MKLSTISCIALMAASPALARDEIRIVGSSTVFPFATAVAEQFGRTTEHPTPIIESTGSGGGMKLFCAGNGVDTPDITNASRRMKASEFELCAENGVNNIVEVLIGYDGIVVANAHEGATYELTIEQLAIALAANGPLPTTWDQVDPSLPAITIEVLGPPPSSGTRDAFEELVMQEGCELTDLVECEGVTIREDGYYVDAGENDNLIVSKLETNPDAVGIFGYSFLDQNADVIKGATVDGIEPTFEAIADGDYTVSRSMYFYVKTDHIGEVPGIEEFVGEFVSEDASGEDGYLSEKGLIPLSEDLLATVSETALTMTPMTGEELH